MKVIRRLDALLEPTKEKVLALKKQLDGAWIVNQDAALCQASGQAFYNISPFTLRDLKSGAKFQQLKADFEAYLDGFSPNVQEILDKFKFRNQIPTLMEADILGYLIEKLMNSRINLSPRPTQDVDGKELLPALDNHAMGTIFEELVRRFNEENNEEAGEHWTPRDVVKLMADLIFLPVAEAIESGTYLVYDGACGTGGMMTVAEERLSDLANQCGKDVSIHLFGQEINPETYAICKADLLLKGEGAEADNMKYGSTLSADAFPSQEFDFMLSNPPYGKSWKTDLEHLGGKTDIKDPRFITQHGGDPEYKMITRSSDGQPHRRSAQRIFPFHRRRRPGREQYPPLDHRKRLAGGHHRPAGEHVLQYRHRHLCLGPDQPQTREPPGQGPAYRRHGMVYAPAPQSRQKKL